MVKRAGLIWKVINNEAQRIELKVFIEDYEKKKKNRVM